MKDKHILMGICGSFCNHGNALKQLEQLVVNNDVQVVVTDNVNHMSTRFFQRDEFINRVEELSGHPVIATLSEAEKIGPMNNFDIMCIVPMTATICAKMANGIYDSPVTLAAKAMIRNNHDIVVGIASNDGLGISGSNLLRLMAYKHFYVIPFAQDSPFDKPYSIVADWAQCEPTLDAALAHVQYQPILCGYKGGE